MTHQKNRIFSLYWDNVSSELVSAQARVFSALGFPIEQHNRHGADHGAWMEEILDSVADDEVGIIVDIDCIPLSVAAVERAITSARSGAVFGCAQSANHIDYRYVYAAPMFLAVTGKTWRSLGRPSLQADKEFDVGGRLTSVALQQAVPVELVYPSDVAVPKWRLGDRCVYGLFTVYEGNYLHLFESRNTELIDCFVGVSEGVIAGGDAVDYREYVLRASVESHDKHARKFFMKHSVSGKASREWRRLKKRLGI